MDEAAKQGWNVWFWTSDQVLPAGVKMFLYALIFVAQYICGLATVTSASRMIFAFSRDGGMPFSSSLKKVSPTYRTPVAAIWTSAVLAWLFTLYTPVYSTVVAVTVIFLFLSFAVPIFFAMRAYGNTWTQMGPWDMGPKFKLVAMLCLLAMVLIFVIGVQPPNGKALWITVAFLGAMAVIWFAAVKGRFQGPPQGVMVQARMKEIEAAEKAVGETIHAA
jgi:amino acid transporter